MKIKHIFPTKYHLSVQNQIFKMYIIRFNFIFIIIFYAIKQILSWYKYFTFLM